MVMAITITNVMESFITITRISLPVTSDIITGEMIPENIITGKMTPEGVTP